MSVETLESLSRWTGWLAVLLGVMAALLALAGWYFSSKLASAKDDEIQRYRAESNARIAEANEGAAQANESAAQAHERAGSLEREAAKQRERAALAELALARLYAVRSLENPVRSALIEKLRGTRFRAPVPVHCVAIDGECTAFATQIHEALLEAGWESQLHAEIRFTNPQGEGFLIRSAADPPAHFAALRDAFAEAGVPMGVAEDSQLAPDQVAIMIGIKIK